MNVEKYHLKSEETLTVFEFISEGPKGIIRKLIHFQPTFQQGIYNLAFGDKDPETGDINDRAISNNGDMEKVLATVVSALYAFFDKHPYAMVYATGSTQARTRLYRMGITKFYEEMNKDFYLFGQIGDNFYDFKIFDRYSVISHSATHAHTFNNALNAGSTYLSRVAFTLLLTV